MDELTIEEKTKLIEEIDGIIKHKELPYNFSWHFVPFWEKIKEKLARDKNKSNEVENEN